MVHDLYILMITAGVVSLLFKLLKQPVVLGYIVAGVLVGPYLFGETLVNADNVKAWDSTLRELHEKYEFARYIRDVLCLFY